MKTYYRGKQLVIGISDLDLISGLSSSDQTKRYVTAETPDGISVYLRVVDRPESGTEPVISYSDSSFDIEVSRSFFDREWSNLWMHKNECTPWSDESIEIFIDKEKYRKSKS